MITSLLDQIIFGMKAKHEKNFIIRFLIPKYLRYKITLKREDVKRLSKNQHG